MNAEKTWTVNDIKAAMIDRGSHWWDRDSMRFFGTRVLPTVYQGLGGVYFVTSEQPPHGDRAFTVRQFVIEKCNIDTHGDVASLTRKAAIATAKQMAGESPAEIVEPLAGQDDAPFSHLAAVDKMLAACDRSSDPWKHAHAKAWRNGLRGNYALGSAVAQMINAAAIYADCHQSRYDGQIGDDGVIGLEWAATVRACLGLLNGELNGLDGGTLDGLLRDMLKAEGFGDE